MDGRIMRCGIISSCQSAAILSIEIVPFSIFIFYVYCSSSVGGVYPQQLFFFPFPFDALPATRHAPEISYQGVAELACKALSTLSQKSETVAEFGLSSPVGSGVKLQPTYILVHFENKGRNHLMAIMDYGFLLDTENDTLTPITISP